MLDQSKQLLGEFDLDGHPMVRPAPFPFPFPSRRSPHLTTTLTSSTPLLRVRLNLQLANLTIARSTLVTPIFLNLATRCHHVLAPSTPHLVAKPILAKIRFFLEEDAVDPNGKLNRPKELAVNKVGHGKHTHIIPTSWEWDRPTISMFRLARDRPHISSHYSA